MRIIKVVFIRGYVFQLPPGLSLGFAGLSGTFPKMPWSPSLWSSFFYFLLFLLGSSSMLGMIEIVLITFKEIKLFTSQWRKELLCGMFNLLNFITTVDSLLSQVVCYFFGLKYKGVVYLQNKNLCQE